MKYVSDFLLGLDLPKGKVVVVHARIKSIAQQLDWRCSYPEITGNIIHYLEEVASPPTIMIPTYTYSYTKSRVFHRLFSRSEVGRFSEEARLHGYHRTPDPIFSFLDTNQYFNEKVNFNIAFGEGSIFDFLHREDAIILNIGLVDFIATQRHYIERYYNVPYRFDKLFSGVVYLNDKEYKELDYLYYVRKLEKNTIGNLKKITKDLISEGVLNIYKVNGINVRWLSCQAYFDFFRSKMAADLYYHVK